MNEKRTDLAIDVQGLCKSFGGKPAVMDFTIQVPTGQICGFLGPNGSGKTTTIRLLTGLLIPDAGEGRCLGYDIRRETAAIKRSVGYMTQRFSLYEDLSISENLDFIARMYELPERRKTVEAMLADLGLTDRRDQLAGTLSGGWKQRLALAACVMHRPKLLLLDEPTAGVDPKARREFWDHIHQLAADGMTVLVSTHYMDEAERCHAIAYIANGRLLARGTTDAVIRDSGLSTWWARAADPRALAGRLTGRPGIDMVAPFGNVLHVSGRDARALEVAITPFRADKGVEWRQAQPDLEDVFIALMATAPEARP
jgi:ABC-2 type transport system ATP-binding protein